SRRRLDPPPPFAGLPASRASHRRHYPDCSVRALERHGIVALDSPRLCPHARRRETRRASANASPGASVNEFFAIFLGSAPALLWLIYFYRRDRFEPEPIRLGLKTFAWGAFGIVPAAAIEQLFSVSELAHSDPRAVSVAALTLATFAIIGPVEEGIKFLFVRLTVCRNPEFDEPVDGLIYASSAALGFAAAENITYVVGSGAGVLVGRALISTLGH